MKKLLSIAVIAAILTGCKNENSKMLNYKVNQAMSKAEWKGSAPDHFHIGSFSVTGDLTANGDGEVKSGDFVIPIASIQDYDLPDPVRQTLLADLKDNFFKLAANPNAKFHITDVKATGTADTSAVKGANFILTGEFTLLNQTHAISFPARIHTTPDSLVAEAKFKIDRNLWGMTNYNDSHARLYILPDVNIHLKIQAAAQKTSPLAYIGAF